MVVSSFWVERNKSKTNKHEEVISALCRLKQQERQWSRGTVALYLFALSAVLIWTNCWSYLKWSWWRNENRDGGEEKREMLLADTQGLPSRTANPSPRALSRSLSLSHLSQSLPSTLFSPKKLSKVHHHGLPLIRPKPATQEWSLQVYSAS